MPSREEYLKWLKEIDPLAVRLPPGIEAICNRVWNEAIDRARAEMQYAVGRDQRGFALEALLKLKQGETK